MKPTKIFIPGTAETVQSNERYSRVVELTCRITGIHFIPDGYGPWETLIRVWSLYYKSLQCDDILYAVLHFIKWGAYPYSEDEPLSWAFNKGTSLEKDTAELLTLFHEELTSSGAAGARELHSWEGFKGMYHLLSNDDQSHIDYGPDSHSRVHRDFLNCRFDYLVHAFDPTDERWARYKEFEKIIHIILPSSAEWSEKNWLDEEFILQSMDREFGTSFENDPDSLTLVARFAAAALKGDYDCELVLTRLSELPFALAERVWPVDTLDRITNAYNSVIKEARRNERCAKRRKSGKLAAYEFGFADVKSTGIHRLMVELISLGMITDKSMKKQAMDMEVHQ